MITLVEAINFRSLRYISQPLSNFHVLVGPNASGKTTFLDAISFLGRLITEGPEQAVLAHSRDFKDLVWNRQGNEFELAIEAKIPSELQGHIIKFGYDTIRFEVAVGWNPKSDAIEIFKERVLLLNSSLKPEKEIERSLFPEYILPPESLDLHKTSRGKQKFSIPIISKIRNGKNHNFYPETSSRISGGKSMYIPALKFSPQTSALGHIPYDESKFPVAIWLNKFLSNSIQQYFLNSQVLKEPSPPSKMHGFSTDGSNLPWAIKFLSETPEKFKDWIAHLQTSIPDLENITTVELLHNKSLYLEVCYKNGLKAPSWMVSDGTLRLLALTIPAYLPEFHGIYLVEEPENGIHPRAIETITSSLSSLYSSQILLATHSPIIVNNVDPENILCFAKDSEGATDIVLGSEHPLLKMWKNEIALGDYFAAGVLG